MPVIDDNLRPALKTVGVGILFQACFDAISKNPNVITQGNGKLILNLEFANPNPEIEKLFHGTKECELSPSEVLSLCYLAEYVRERHHKNEAYEYDISVQIERAFHSDQKLKEWYFGDGIIRWHDGDKWSALPIQETKAINYTPETSSRIIEDEIIRVINKKTSEAKRKNYNDTCGLLVSVMPKASNIGYQRILDSIDVSNYNATYLVEYSNSFRSGTVIDLLSHKNNYPDQPLTITPQLVLV